MRICIVGAGQMGRQIALNAALHGYETTLSDADKAAVDASRDWAEEYLRGRIEKGRLTREQAEACRENLSILGEVRVAAQRADIVIEAITEKLDVKRKLFAELDEVCPANTIFATNSSSFCPSKLADATSRPDKMIGMHFFYPPLVMELVEVIRGPQTSEETVCTILELARGFGKEPILLRKEINGFIVNRLLGRLFEEACRLIQSGVATPEEIDRAVEKGLRHPMGPCKIMDQTGLDTVYLVRVQRYEESRDEIDKPQPLMKEMYEKGLLGIKSGRGFYEYKK